MATLDTKTPSPFGVRDENGDFMKVLEREDRIMDQLQAESDALPTPVTLDGKYLKPVSELAKCLVGRIVRWPFADGYAYYRVTRIQPVKLQHLKYGDAWQIHPETIRGTNLVGLANMVAREIEFKKLFAKKA